MERPTREINEYLDLNESQVAGIQRDMASLDRGKGVVKFAGFSGAISRTVWVTLPTIACPPSRAAP
jgi:hypothetical protein